MGTLSLMQFIFRSDIEQWQRWWSLLFVSPYYVLKCFSIYAVSLVNTKLQLPCVSVLYVFIYIQSNLGNRLCTLEHKKTILCCFYSFSWHLWWRVELSHLELKTLRLQGWSLPSIILVDSFFVHWGQNPTNTQLEALQGSWGVFNMSSFKHFIEPNVHNWLQMSQNEILIITNKDYRLQICIPLEGKLLTIIFVK